MWQFNKRPLSADPKFTDIPKYIFADVYVTIDFIFSDNHFIFCQFFFSQLGHIRLVFAELGLELGASYLPGSTSPTFPTPC